MPPRLAGIRKERIHEPQTLMNPKQEHRSTSTGYFFISVKRIPAVVFAVLLAGQIHGQASGQAWKEPREIWFSQPAARWKLGLPVGHGRLGAMVRGTYPNAWCPRAAIPSSNRSSADQSYRSSPTTIAASGR